MCDLRVSRSRHFIGKIRITDRVKGRVDSRGFSSTDEKGRDILYMVSGNVSFCLNMRFIDKFLQ